MRNKKTTTIDQTNRIVEGTTIEGNISTNTDFRIDGKLIGNFASKGKLVIGSTGYITGELSCKSIDIEGFFSGKLKSEGLLSIKSSAKIKGEIQTKQLSVEPGATFDAICSMTENSIAMNNKTQQAS